LEKNKVEILTQYQLEDRYFNGNYNIVQWSGYSGAGYRDTKGLYDKIQNLVIRFGPDTVHIAGVTPSGIGIVSKIVKSLNIPNTIMGGIVSQEAIKGTNALDESESFKDLDFALFYKTSWDLMKNNTPINQIGIYSTKYDILYPTSKSSISNKKYSYTIELILKAAYFLNKYNSNKKVYQIYFEGGKIAEDELSTLLDKNINCPNLYVCLYEGWAAGKLEKDYRAVTKILTKYFGYVNDNNSRKINNGNTSWQQNNVNIYFKYQYGVPDI